MKLPLIMAMIVALAVVSMLPNAFAQVDFLCDHNGPTARGQALGIVCHTTQDPPTMIIPAIPLITGLGIGIVAWGVISARKTR